MRQVVHFMRQVVHFNRRFECFIGHFINIDRPLMHFARQEVNFMWHLAYFKCQVDDLRWQVNQLETKVVFFNVKVEDKLGD